MHRNKDFKRSSPSPHQTFDENRGASPQLNSYNNINQFMPSKEEKPRMTVLQNFKEINRIVTNTFMKKKDLESKYKKGVPADVLAKTEHEEQVVSNMASIMKKMHSPRNFCEGPRRFGSVTAY